MLYKWHTLESNQQCCNAFIISLSDGTPFFSSEFPQPLRQNQVELYTKVLAHRYLRYWRKEQNVMQENEYIWTQKRSALKRVSRCVNPIKMRQEGRITRDQNGRITKSRILYAVVTSDKNAN